MSFNLKTQVELLLRVAEEFFCEDGWCSTAVVVYKRGQIHIIEDEICNDKEVVKRKALKLIRRIKPEAVIMIGEGWTDLDDLLCRAGISLEYYPRGEALFALGLTAEQRLIIVQPFIRKDEGVFLVEPQYCEAFDCWFDDCKLSA
jgi:hypothetical protein